MKTFRASAVSATLLGTVLCAPIANAEITLLERDNGTHLLNDLEVSVGGSARVGFSNKMGSIDDGARSHRGTDDGSRLRVNVNYYLPDDWHLLGRYEMGTDIFNDVGWKHHQTPGKDNTTRRKLYFGVANPTYGTFTFGKQDSVFYNVVGKPTDKWVMDMKGQGPANGISGDYDGSYRARDIFMYTNTFGPVQIYTSGNLADSDYHKGNFTYRRKGGGALGAIYAIEPDLKVGTAYSYNKADLRKDGNPEKSTWDQQSLGTSISWAPGNWYLAGMIGYYKDFIPADRAGGISSAALNPDQYFRGNAHGWEGYAGYTIPVAGGWVTGIQPYIAESALRFQHYSETLNYVGMNIAFAYGFSISLEHQFSNTSDHQPDISKARLRYDF
ncbi:porin [Carnimonas nigrificans]|uniref:porin n=1 Tax=Carnimonas nigrificans TaxID=64323 RepID=UPI000471EB55|nr:porin [Carnimonas nigrificans]